MTLAELEEIKKNYKVIEIAVDFINPSYNISRAKHLDTARYIVCTLTENGIPRAVKDNEVARIRLQKPDRQPVYNDCDILEDGRVFITLTEQILAVEGNAVCDIQLTDGETGIIYSTKNFIVNIDKTAVDHSVIESSYEFNALNNLIATNDKLNKELEANEEIRKANEDERKDNENIRQDNEANREIAENKREDAEAIRVANENVRKANEIVRQDQESDRQTNTATAIANAETATKKANDAADDLQAKLDAHHFVLTEDKDVAGGVPSLDANTKVPIAELYEATIKSKGITQLTDSVTSTSTTTAATPNSVKTVNDALITEINRATNAEKTLTDNLNSEISRAKSAESTLTTNLNAEITRAKATESDLDTKKVDKTTVAGANNLGLVKSGTDITVDTSGNVSVNDNSHKHTVSNISDLTATASELNVLDGITATTTELNYTDGVTSNIQTQLDSKAPLASPALTGTPTAPTASAGTNTTQIATTAFVQTAVSNGIAASDAMRIMGTIGTSGTVTALPTTYKTGWTYRVVTAGTYAGQVCEIGDLIVALVDRSGSGNLDSDWCVAQTNINGAITGVKSGDAYITVSQSGSVVTITHKDVARTNTTSTASPSSGGTFTAIDSVISDTKGHITKVNTKTITLPTTVYTISLTGDVTGSGTFNGSDSLNIKTTSTNGGHYVGISSPSNTNLLWVDTGNNGILKYYDGETWVEIAGSTEILNSIQSYLTRAQALYDSMYLDCDGETPHLRVVTLIKIKGGTPQQRLIDGGISFDGGTPINRLLGV